MRKFVHVVLLLPSILAPTASAQTEDERAVIRAAASYILGDNLRKHNAHARITFDARLVRSRPVYARADLTQLDPGVANDLAEIFGSPHRKLEQATDCQPGVCRVPGVDHVVFFGTPEITDDRARVVVIIDTVAERSDAHRSAATIELRRTEQGAWLVINSSYRVT